MQKSEQYLKAKEYIKAIDDIDYILDGYNEIKTLSSNDGYIVRGEILCYLKHHVLGIAPNYESYPDDISECSSEFMVDLVQFLKDERKKFDKKLL